MIWPDAYAADSVEVHLDLTSDNPYQHAPTMRATLFPVFTAKGISRTPAAVLDTARRAHYYREFIDASRTRVLHTRFRPARIGGCTIRQLVHLRFNYVGRDPTSSP